MDHSEVFSIGEFSKRTGISIRNLRYYDEVGLLVPEKHPTSGHRIYHYEDILTLQKILSLKFLGYRLDEISNFLHKTSFTIDLNETLTLHLKALETEKDRIEQSMKMIKRVIHLLKEEKEVDNHLLFSLICSLPMEPIQKEWLERHLLADVSERLFEKLEEETTTLDKIFVQMSKKVKILYGRALNDPEVQEMVETYKEATFSVLGEELVQKLVHVNVKEEDFQELEDLTPSPFTDDEQKWLIQAIDYYMQQSESEEK